MLRLFLWPLALCAVPVFAQAPRAILVDGPGPWQTAQWSFTVSQFSGILADAGYSVTTVSPVDLPSALGSLGRLLAVPSLESLPFGTFNAITAFAQSGGSLMASGGEPFRDALYLTPGGQWLDSAAYLQAVGSAPPQGVFTPQLIPTISPSKEQFTALSGVRVPVARSRGLSSSLPANSPGRYRVIGDLLAPAATLYVGNNPILFNPSTSLLVWLPWPQVFDPLRAQLVSALAAAPSQLSLQNAGPDQLVWLPGEAITGSASIRNQSNSAVQASLQWSVAGPAGVTPKPAASLTIPAGNLDNVPLEIGSPPAGDYTLTFRLMLGNQEVDRLDSPVRVLDPALSRQPDQKIRVVNGSFSAAGRHIFLQGVNYWPRSIAGIEAYEFNGESWLSRARYDPDVVEADLTEIAALNFNLVNIQYGYGDVPALFDQGIRSQEGRSLIDFLERCRQHGIWARIFFPVAQFDTAYTGDLSPNLGSWIHAADLPGNDRVFAYELLWEPMVGPYRGRTDLDADWRSWVNDQYGSLANAQQAWAVTAPLDGSGQLTNPSDDQFANDGPWRIMVAAYRRFLEDYLGRNFGAMAREIRRNDPDTLLTYRNWITMTAVHNANTGYDIGTGAAHLDFMSPERYTPVLAWPDDRAYGLVTAYSRYRTGGKPVQWAEFGSDVGPDGGTPASQAAQTAICDTMMRQVADEGSNAASVWWWPGGYGPTTFGSDYGIINPDGSPRGCAVTLSQWGATFAAAPPDLHLDPPTTLTIDRDADARGSYGLFLDYQDSYVQARQAGMSVVLLDQGRGTDTATMPLIQVGNPVYTGSGPLKFANAEFAGIRVVCPTLDVTVENNASVAIPTGATCQLTPTLVNSGEARWLPGSSAKGGVTLHTSAGDAPLGAPLASLDRTAMGPLTVTMGQGAAAVTGRMKIAGVGDFGEVLNLTLAVDSTLTGACAISLSSTGAIGAPVAGATGTVNVSTPSGCGWTASSPQPWVSVTPAASSGNGAAAYSILPNPGSVRQTTITIAGHPFTVTQDAAANASLASAALSTASLNFTTQAIGTTSPAQTLKLTNTGAVALTVSSVEIGGLNDGDFSETDTCGANLAPGASCTIQIAFTPVAADIRTASLFVNGNLAGSLPSVSLSGTGAATGPTPSILAMVDAWGYSAGIAPGLWVVIAGSNLAGPPQTWNLTGVTQLPAALGDATVTFNGTPAALLYVSATQINALVPGNVAPGPVQVVVQVDGVRSSPFAVTARAAQPAVYAPPAADGSTFFVTAALAGTATLIGNGATDPRVVRPAYPGDTLDLYMIGLGATLDPTQFITDQVFQGAFLLSAPVTASVGGEPAKVVFAGLTSPGLYLVRVVVPSDLKAGPQPLQVSAGGIPTRPSLVLQIGVPPPG